MADPSLPKNASSRGDQSSEAKEARWLDWTGGHSRTLRLRQRINAVTLLHDTWSRGSALGWGEVLDEAEELSTAVRTITAHMKVASTQTQH